MEQRTKGRIMVFCLEGRVTIVRNGAGSILIRLEDDTHADRLTPISELPLKHNEALDLAELLATFTKGGE